MPDDPQERITQLEINLLHQQRLFEQLNEVVTEQAFRSDRLSQRIGELEKQLRDLKDKFGQEERNIEDEKPPHY